MLKLFTRIYRLCNSSLSLSLILSLSFFFFWIPLYLLISPYLSISLSIYLSIYPVSLSLTDYMYVYTYVYSSSHKSFAVFTGETWIHFDTTTLLYSTLWWMWLTQADEDFRQRNTQNHLRMTLKSLKFIQGKEGCSYLTMLSMSSLSSCAFYRDKSILESLNHCNVRLYISSMWRKLWIIHFSN